MSGLEKALFNLKVSKFLKEKPKENDERGREWESRRETFVYTWNYHYHFLGFLFFGVIGACVFCLPLFDSQKSANQRKCRVFKKVYSSFSVFRYNGEKASVWGFYHGLLFEGLSLIFFQFFFSVEKYSGFPFPIFPRLSTFIFFLSCQVSGYK